MGSTSAATCSNLKNIRLIFFKFAWQNKTAACHNQLILTMVETENSRKRWILLKVQKGLVLIQQKDLCIIQFMDPPELRELRKAPFKRKLTHLLLKILETEEMNVDMRYIDLSGFCSLISFLSTR